MEIGTFDLTPSRSYRQVLGNGYKSVVALMRRRIELGSVVVGEKAAVIEVVTAVRGIHYRLLRDEMPLMPLIPLKQDASYVSAMLAKAYPDRESMPFRIEFISRAKAFDEGFSPAFFKESGNEPVGLLRRQATRGTDVLSRDDGDMLCRHIDGFVTAYAATFIRIHGGRVGPRARIVRIPSAARRIGDFLGEVMLDTVAYAAAGRHLRARPLAELLSFLASRPALAMVEKGRDRSFVFLCA